jgi:hypothetical protein
MNRQDHMPGYLLAGLLLLTLARLVIAGFTELSADEAYYYMWSQRLDWSYYSKGPGIAALIWLSTSIFGASELGIRIPASLLALISSLMLWRLIRNMFDMKIASWTLVILNLTPIFNAGSFLMTIDPLSITFWIAAMLCLWQALHTDRPDSPQWPLAGLMIGLGFLCKYTNALQLIAVILLLSCSKRWRPFLLKPGPYFMLAVFALCTIPVWLWNAENHWITFTHLKDHTESAPGSSSFNLLELGEFLGGHLFVYSPLFFIGLAWAILRGSRNLFRGNKEAFLISFALPILVLYLVISLRNAGELNWTAPGIISATALLPYYWRNIRIHPRNKKILQTTAFSLAAGLTLLMMNTDMPRAIGLRWGYSHDNAPPAKDLATHLKEPHLVLDNVADFSTRLRGWNTTATHMAKWIKSIAGKQGESIFLIANRYQTAAAMNYYLPQDLPIIHPTRRHPRVHTPESRAPVHQFSFWPGYSSPSHSLPNAIGKSQFLGRTSIYLSDDSSRKSPPDAIKNAFIEWKLVDVVQILRRNKTMRTIKIFVCRTYTGFNL